MSTGSDHLHPQTRAIHAGQGVDPATGVFKRPISMANNAALTPGSDAFPAYFYTRWGNPSIEALEARLANLEGAEACCFTASGMAAIATLLCHALQGGGHAVVAESVYTDTKRFLTDGRAGNVTVDFVDATDANNVAAALRPDTKLVYIESPANPLTLLTDIAAVARIVRPMGALLAIDSTFSGMVCQKPLALGVDVVLHSTTKYINGHGDALGGAILGAKSLIDPIRRTMGYFGGCASPFNAWLVMRGCATLPLRMAMHNHNALTLATWLEGQEMIAAVRYPGLPSHPQHELAKRQMPGGFGGMLNFSLRAEPHEHVAFMRYLRLCTNAVSLGDLETLVMYFGPDYFANWVALPDRAEHFRRFAGPGFFRFSVGVEHVDDLIADIEQALARVIAGRRRHATGAAPA